MLATLGFDPLWVLNNVVIKMECSIKIESLRASHSLLLYFES